MTISTFRSLGLLMAALMCAAGAGVVAPLAVDAAPTEQTEPSAASVAGTGTEADAAAPSTSDSAQRQHVHAHHGKDVVDIADDSVLEAGKEADSVVSVFGNTRVEGTVRSDVVSVFGNDYIDNNVGGDAVSVFGNVELGPHAAIAGDVVTIFGELTRDPLATIGGESRSIFGRHLSAPTGLRSWIEHCLIYGRPLSLAGGLGWAWGVALSLLALYLCIAVVVRSGVESCVETFERHPGASILAALLAGLLTPLVLILLCVTIIGIAAVPFAVMGLVCIAFLGKTVILAWLGRAALRLRGTDASGTHTVPHPALAVLVGGLIVLALYLVPFFGFLFYNLLGFLGFGAVVYTAILGLRARQDARTATASGRSGVSGAMPPAGAVPPTESSPAGGTPPPFAAAAAASPVVTADLPRAGFWIRMIALLIDVVLVGACTHLLHSYSNAHLVLLAAYGAIMWKLRGSTVGGIVFDLRVIRLDGRDMDWETAIIRALSCFLSLVVAGLGFFWIAFDPANQAWHDKIAGTVVVRVPKSLPPV